MFGLRLMPMMTQELKSFTVAFLTRGSLVLSDFLVLAITVATTYRTLKESRGLRLSKKGTLSQVMFKDGENISFS